MLRRHGARLCNNRHGPGIRKRKMDPFLEGQLKQIPEYIAISTGGSRPIAFATAAPEPLQDANLGEVDIDVAWAQGTGRGSSIEDLLNAPVARLDPVRMGMPPFLVDRLKDKGITTVTPVQARLFQETYAHNDAAICGPTGSGKTLGLAMAITAKLLRQGPMTVLSTLVLAPSEPLVLQIDAWLKELWRFQGDPRLSLTATKPTDVNRLFGNLRIKVRDKTTQVLTTPYVIIATPEVMWAAYQARLHALACHPKRRISVSNIRVLPTVDSIFIDEVDVVLPSGAKNAPGNLLLSDMLGRNKFESQLQSVFTSATLAPTTVNHIRRFMKKSIFASKSAHIFENEDTAGDRLAAAMAQSANGGTTFGNEEMATARKLGCPTNVVHRFYVADTAEEQRKAFDDVVATVVDGAELLATQSGTDEAFDRAEAAAAVRGLVIVRDLAHAEEIRRDVLGGLTIPATSEALSAGHVTRRFTEDAWTASARASANSDAVTVRAKGPKFLLVPEESVRGLDVHGATHVFIMNRPKSALEYVHDAGRVGRMGAHGTAVSVMKRSDVRHVHQFCEAVGIAFRVERRKYASIDVAALRGMDPADNV
jgi:superfamily II DNA/RNA helicase